MLFTWRNYQNKEFLIISNYASNLADELKEKIFIVFLINRKNRSFINMKNTN